MRFSVMYLVAVAAVERHEDLDQVAVGDEQAASPASPWPTLSRWRAGDEVLRPKTARSGIASVSTIAKPENSAPATKYGGKIVEWQPGVLPIAKSSDTTLCTEMTSGVASPASSR